jgi:hypothetical protein
MTATWASTVPRSRLWMMGRSSQETVAGYFHRHPIFGLGPKYNSNARDLSLVGNGAL